MEVIPPKESSDSIKDNLECKKGVYTYSREELLKIRFTDYCTKMPPYLVGTDIMKREKNNYNKESPSNEEKTTQVKESASKKKNQEPEISLRPETSRGGSSRFPSHRHNGSNGHDLRYKDFAGRNRNEDTTDKWQRFYNSKKEFNSKNNNQSVRSGNNHHRNNFNKNVETEPEWMSASITDVDVIELRGFEDDVLKKRKPKTKERHTDENKVEHKTRSEPKADKVTTKTTSNSAETVPQPVSKPVALNQQKPSDEITSINDFLNMESVPGIESLLSDLTNGESEKQGVGESRLLKFFHSRKQASPPPPIPKQEDFLAKPEILIPSPGDPESYFAPISPATLTTPFYGMQEVREQPKEVPVQLLKQLQQNPPRSYDPVKEKSYAGDIDSFSSNGRIVQQKKEEEGGGLSAFEKFAAMVEGARLPNVEMVQHPPAMPQLPQAHHVHPPFPIIHGRPPMAIPDPQLLHYPPPVHNIPVSEMFNNRNLLPNPLHHPFQTAPPIYSHHDGQEVFPSDHAIDHKLLQLPQSKALLSGLRSGAVTQNVLQNQLKRTNTTELQKKIILNVLKLDQYERDNGSFHAEEPRSSRPPPPMMKKKEDSGLSSFTPTVVMKRMAAFKREGGDSRNSPFEQQPPSLQHQYLNENSLSQFFSSEVLASPALPPLPTSKALTLEEIEKQRL